MIWKGYFVKLIAEKISKIVRELTNGFSIGTEFPQKLCINVLDITKRN